MSDDLHDYYVTFGCKYAYEAHPAFPIAHPDGWVRITAPDELTARQLVISWLGRQWASIYTEDEWNDPHRPSAEIGNERLFPRGELAFLPWQEQAVAP